MRQELNLASVFDSDFAVGFAVTLQSVMDTLAPDTRLNVHAMGLNLSSAVKDKLTSTIQAPRRGHRIVFLTPEGNPACQRFYSTLKRYGYTDYNTRCFFATLMLPDSFSGADRFMYLDADFFVNRDLGEVYWQPFASHPLKAVEDEAAKTTLPKLPVRDFVFLGLDDQAAYFNSGMFLMDLHYWRQHGFAQKALELTERLASHYRRTAPRGIRPTDQGVLNSLYHNNWELLDSLWNRQGPYHCGIVGELRAGQKSLIHYLTRPKPWEVPECDDCKEFYAALDRTAFSGWRPSRFRSGVSYYLRPLKYRLWKLFHPKA